MKKYMHTIEGRPAFFQEDQIVFANGSVRVSEMASSLYQIRKEKALSIAHRESYGFNTNPNDYSYIIIHIDKS